jgi:hypothetical protein
MPDLPLNSISVLVPEITSPASLIFDATSKTFPTLGNELSLPLPVGLQ